MYRNRFSCESLPLHLFPAKFKQWLEDIKLTRPFLVEEEDEELIVVGQNAYAYILSLVDSAQFDVKVGSASEPAHLEGIRVVSSFYVTYELKDSFDLLPTDIEYRVISK